MAFEMGFSLIMPYPSLYGHKYNEFARTLKQPTFLFNSNDCLVCIMIFSRFPYVVRAILIMSFYAQP